LLPPDDIHRRLLFILHEGLVEIRNRVHEPERVHFLSDLLEVIPVWMVTWEPGHHDVIRGMLQNYERRFPPMFNYVRYFDGQDLPEAFRMPDRS